MDNTTLHTFLLYVYPSLPPNTRLPLTLTPPSSHCPNALRNLVLLGSWDNFTRPYPLELDARRGRNYWHGCFTFSDIICDGDLETPVAKRDGPLKMGGTYWYYVSQFSQQQSKVTDLIQYKVDGDDECHNPSEPSTTFCPLLPGQRLNVLELPSEGHNRSKSDPSDGFTRNPSDRYLNPVPPAPLSLRPIPSPDQRAASSESDRLPLPSPWAPRSATYPPNDAFLSPNVVRHARSASASPHMPSTQLFADFRLLKERIATKRSATRCCNSLKSRELEIGSPVLISTTADDLNLIPLAKFRPPPTSAPVANATPANRAIPTIRKEFSPLGSHPVAPIDPVPALQRKASLRQRRSAVVTGASRPGSSRGRANSSDTRRTQHYLFSNDPWLSTPKPEQRFELAAPDFDKNTQPVPTLQRPSTSLTPPPADERPSSRHGNNQTSTLRPAPLDKELPPLPRYLKPAPLFACSDHEPVELLVELPVELPADVPVELPAEEIQTKEEVQEADGEVLDDLIMHYDDEKPSSHFSTWSNESMAFDYPTSDDEVTNSPTFSSLASSDAGSPLQCSSRYSYMISQHESEEDDVSSQEEEEEEQTTGFLSATPPRLDDVRISAFGADLFSLDIQHADSAPRRQAACFGLGFHYSLPDDDTTSKTTITESSLRPEPSVQRESSLSQLNGLINDFAYLGDAVI
jgi:hypothetical protein